ncbi:MAG: hypothetical protein RLZZ490_632 [Cyanobacteriota bacterium]|jgi:hypothetical protein
MRSGIGIRIQQAQELLSEAIEWIVYIASAIIRAFDEGYEQKTTKIAKRARLSRQTLYSHLPIMKVTEIGKIFLPFRPKDIHSLKTPNNYHIIGF